MRPSAKDRPSNQWVVTAQLDEATFERMEQLQASTGFSRSRLFRVLIAGAKINVNQQTKAATEEDE